MQLFVITHPKFLEDEGRKIASLMEDSDCIIHLRKPNGDIWNYEAILKDIPVGFHARIMIHGGYELIQDYKLKGLHFSTHNRSLRNTIYCEYASTSCHSIAESENIGNEYNHHFLSPLFPSISKQGYDSTLNHSEIAGYIQKVASGNIVALGGIDSSNLGAVARLGFKASAVLGAVWGDGKINIHEIRKNLKNLYSCLTHAPIV